MKTGYTDAAGYCLVASAVRDMPNGKRRLLSVVLGTASREARADESQKLLNWGFQAFDAVRLFEAGKADGHACRSGRASCPRRSWARPARVFVTVPKGEGDKLKTTGRAHRPAGRAAGQGPARRADQGQPPPAARRWPTVPLVVLEPVELAGIFGRAWDALRLWIK